MIEKYKKHGKTFILAFYIKIGWNFLLCNIVLQVIHALRLKLIGFKFECVISIMNLIASKSSCCSECFYE